MLLGLMYVSDGAKALVPVIYVGVCSSMSCREGVLVSLRPNIVSRASSQQHGAVCTSEYALCRSCLDDLTGHFLESF